MHKKCEFKLSEGHVDRDLEHFEIRYGSIDEGGWEDWLPMALIGNKSGKFVVEFLVDTEDSSYSQAIDRLYRQLNFYLIEKEENDPWGYAQHHCTTAANAYSNIHWSFFNSLSDQLYQFQDMFIGKLKNDDLPAKLLNEGELEKQFVLPIVYKCLINTPSLHAYAHPWKQSTRCKPNCNEGRGIIESPLVYHGCPTCWKLSKKWAAVNFFGHHCFDIIVGKQGQSIAVELKFLGRKKSNKKANDEFQRFIGQCTLAKLVHTRVIGFCVAEEGCLDFSKAEYISDLLEKGISVVIRKFVSKD